MRITQRALWLTTLLLISAGVVLAARVEREPPRTLPDRVLETRATLRAGQFRDPSLRLLWDNPFDMFGAAGVVTFEQLPRQVPIRMVDIDMKRVKAGPSVISLRDKRASASLAGKMVEMRRVDWSKLNFSGVTLTIDNVSSISHGHYSIVFRYSITQPNIVKVPLRFQPVFDGSAKDVLCYNMYTHKTGPADALPGTISLVYTGLNTPLKCATDTIGIRVYDADLKELVTISAPMKFEFTKRYVDITRDNIRDYLALPGKAKSTMTVLGNEPDTLQTLSGQYLMEPALLFVRTSTGNFAKALVGLETGVNNYRHIDLWDARCYARDQAAFNATPYLPNGGDSNLEYIQQFGNGGYLFNTNNFDFDMNGENAGAGEGDISLTTSGAPNSASIITHPLARIAY